ncbi:uncharacterized protein LOC133292196 isoform X2 [Gastrolobium bilobum]|uniref:uncharacterized protein LOC133292196 isoform X2 n=1 Tax=Gastrolobium bilobum TaxID=150636 RepID=UPI002AAFFAFA|nr:uncharacterized protein LOC133292196 isoform X2 [Gastrolobium bilobum]
MFDFVSFLFFFPCKRISVSRSLFQILVFLFKLELNLFLVNSITRVNQVKLLCLFVTCMSEKLYICRQYLSLELGLGILLITFRKKSFGATKECLKEATNINKLLSTLGIPKMLLVLITLPSRCGTLDMVSN